MWPSPPTPITTVVEPGVSSVQARLDRVVRRQRRVGQRRRSDGVEVADRDEQPRRRDEQVVGEPAVEAEPAAADRRSGRSRHRGSRPRARTCGTRRSPTGRRRATGSPIVEPVTPAPERRDRAGGLVTERERQRPRQRPLRPLHDVEVRVAEAGGRRSSSSTSPGPGSGRRTSRSSGSACQSTSWTARISAVDRDGASTSANFAPRRLAPRRDVLASGCRPRAPRTRAGSGARPTRGAPRRRRRRSARGARSGRASRAACRSSSRAPPWTWSARSTTSCSTFAPKNLIIETSVRAALEPYVSIFHAACSVISRAACISRGRVGDPVLHRLLVAQQAAA